MTTRRFQRVAVMMGGPSDEREVSLASGRAVSAALRSRGYDVREVLVDGRSADVPAGTEAVFIALHGAYGEDGELQAQLEARGLPFTGSGSAASRRAFDKVESKRVFARHGIPTPPWETVEAGGARTLPLPVVVKPPRQGSSIGMSRVFDEAAWAPALETALRYDRPAMVEAYIPGAELTVGVVGDTVLPVVEIRAPEGAYDFRAKYTAGMTTYLCPAPLDEATTRRCQELGRAVFEALGCRGIGRTDLRLAPDGRLYVLEMNTIPGFTGTSLLPKAARQAGLDFESLCERVLDLAGHGERLC